MAKENFMKSETIYCDICEKKKGASNHWYKLSARIGQLLIQKSGGVDFSEIELDICGESCLIKAISERLGKL